MRLRTSPVPQTANPLRSRLGFRSKTGEFGPLADALLAHGLTFVPAPDSSSEGAMTDTLRQDIRNALRVLLSGVVLGGDALKTPRGGPLRGVIDSLHLRR